MNSDYSRVACVWCNAGSMYFFKEDSYYLFNGRRLDIEDGYPRLIHDKWDFCSESLLEMNFESEASAAAAATLSHSIVYITLGIILLLVIRPH